MIIKCQAKSMYVCYISVGTMLFAHILHLPFLHHLLLSKLCTVILRSKYFLFLLVSTYFKGLIILLRSTALLLRRKGWDYDRIERCCLYIRSFPYRKYHYFEPNDKWWLRKTFLVKKLLPWPRVELRTLTR